MAYHVICYFFLQLCQRVGCDHVLDSETMEDRCGVCGGNGDSCRKVRSAYTDSPDQSGKKSFEVILRDFFTLFLLEPLNLMKIQMRF